MHGADEGKAGEGDTSPSSRVSTIAFLSEGGGASRPFPSCHRARHRGAPTSRNGLMTDRQCQTFSKGDDHNT